MNKSKGTKNILLSILAITLSLTLVGCNKDDTKVVKEETAIEAPMEKGTRPPTPKVEPTKDVQTSNPVAIETVEKIVDETSIVVENDQLDLAALGFEIKDNLLYFNGTLLSANEIVNYTIEKDEARFNNADSSSIIINEMGDIEAIFPIGLILNVKSKLTVFELSYEDATFTLPTIVNLTGTDGWYRLTLADNIYLRFNDTTMEIHVDDLSVSLDGKTNDILTKFNDAVLSTSYIKTYYVNAPNIRLSYEDGSVLTHTIGGDTTFSKLDDAKATNTDTPTVEIEDETIAIEEEVTTTIPQEELVEVLPIIEDEVQTINTEPTTTEDENIEATVVTEKKEVAAVTEIEKATAITEIEDASAVTEMEEATAITEIEDASAVTEMEEATVVPAIEEAEITIQSPEVAAGNVANFEDMKAYESPVDTPNHIGVVGNYAFLTGDFNSSIQESFIGGGLNIVIDKEVSTKLSIALEMGVGYNKFDKNKTLLTITPMFTVDYNFKQLNSDSIIPYATLGVGSMIAVDGKDSIYFKAKAGFGLKYNIKNKWMLKTGVNYSFNYTSTGTLHGLEVPIGIMYKF